MSFDDELGPAARGVALPCRELRRRFAAGSRRVWGGRGARTVLNRGAGEGARTLTLRSTGT